MCQVFLLNSIQFDCKNEYIVLKFRHEPLDQITYFACYINKRM